MYHVDARNVLSEALELHKSIEKSGSSSSELENKIEELYQKYSQKVCSVQGNQKEHLTRKHFNETME